APRRGPAAARTPLNAATRDRRTSDETAGGPRTRARANAVGARYSVRRSVRAALSEVGLYESGCHSRLRAKRERRPRCHRVLLSTARAYWTVTVPFMPG